MYKRNKGYTLLELAIVIAIISIIGTLVVPNLLHFNDAWVLKSTAYMIAQDIRRTQNMSITQCKPFLFQLRTNQFCYIIKPNENYADAIKIVKLDPRIIKIKSTLMDAGLKGEFIGTKDLIFSETGAPNQAGTIELETKHSSIKLTVALATGRVHVYD